MPFSTGETEMNKIDHQRFTGFATLYNSSRPKPPQKIVDIILGYRSGERINRIVDMGSGTGLSTAIWEEAADEIIGIEPTPDMRHLAQERFANITFLDKSSYATDLETSSVDVVTCSQSFHWMEPGATIKEAARILKPGGIFAVYDCNWPVVWNWNAERAYEALFVEVKNLIENFPDLRESESKFPKENHLTNLRTSGQFRYTRQVLFDNIEPCNAERFVNIALSQGKIQNLIKKSVTEIEPPLQQFAEICKSVTNPVMRVCYVMNIGIR